MNIIVLYHIIYEIILYEILYYIILYIILYYIILYYIILYYIILYYITLFYIIETFHYRKREGERKTSFHRTDQNSNSMFHCKLKRKE